MRSYELIRSGRKTLSLEITRDGTVLVRAPLRMPRSSIDAFVRVKKEWTARKKELCARRIAFEKANFGTPEQLAALTEKARRILPQKTEEWARIMGVSPAGIRISQAKTRFGSCSATNCISYSCRLMAYPEDAVDYVVVHELAHIRHKDHSPAFYAFVARFLPDYRRREAILRPKD